MRGGVGNNERDVCGIGGMHEQHLLGEDSAQTVGNEYNFSVLPDSLPLQPLPENLRELDRGKLSVA